MAVDWIRRFVLVSILFAGFYYLKENPDLRKRIYSEEPIRVKIEGPVLNPGFYSLDAGSNGKDLIELAGGYLPGAQIKTEDSILEQPLEDGQVLNLGKR
ncbi:SLBB domain protein [Leptospira wolbachii serovar Codice str. CDC]|uniref:SLBB domain protein n=1 Tax=Leptospira wolbachii serovar Codice str. CDC TaxID=1218599 RepID=R9A3Y8_9LEPT|nr:SLBB domain protein [Leptospira wolbachii]EOQ96797.1 SLBB domain protein [Leptospira wolbachii serovar Codice str. CDC]